MHTRARASSDEVATREKRGRQPLPSRAISLARGRAWLFSCIAAFARRTEKKERLLVVYCDISRWPILVFAENTCFTLISVACGNYKYLHVTKNVTRIYRKCICSGKRQSTYSSVVATSTARATMAHVDWIIRRQINRSRRKVRLGERKQQLRL